MWGERDLDPQSQTRKDLQSLRLPITGYLPIILSGWYDSNVRSPLQHAPVPKTGEVYQLLHIQIITFQLVNDLKIKKSFIITEEALYKLYCIVTLITFLKIYFITIPISKRHAIKWTSAKGWTNNRTNMWINLTHVFLYLYLVI